MLESLRASEALGGVGTRGSQQCRVTDLIHWVIVDEIAANRYPALNWKQDLRYAQHRFTEHEGFGEGTASVCIAVERYIMHSALGLRKLLVQRVLTEEVINRDRPVLSYPCTRPPQEQWQFEGTVDMENLHHFVRHYDLDRPREEGLRLQRIANLLIHSFVFAVWPEDGGDYEDARVFFNSDYVKNQLVYEMRVLDFKTIVEDVLNDETVYTTVDRATGKFHKHNWEWKQRQEERRRDEARRRSQDLEQPAHQSAA